MHISHSPRLHERSGSAAAIVLQQARKLHRAATSQSLADSLPVLRRLLATHTLRGLSLTALHRQRELVQRKHILRALAIEAGYGSWEDYRAALERLSADELQHFDIIRQHVGYPNLWFGNQAYAQAHAARYGGRAMRVGPHAVVLAQPVAQTFVAGAE